VNFETKEQSKQWMHTHSPNKLKSLNKHLPARKLMAVFWDMKGMLMVEFMQQGMTVMSEVYFKTYKKCVGPFRAKGMHGFLASWCTAHP
jgi:hypothetical protein